MRETKMRDTPLLSDHIVDPKQVVDQPVPTNGAEEKDSEESRHSHVEHLQRILAGARREGQVLETTGRSVDQLVLLHFIRLALFGKTSQCFQEIISQDR